MSAEVLRFGVRDGAHRRATTWSLWTEGTNEVYVGCHVVSGELRAGLHQSGRWHLAFNREAFDAGVREAIPPHENPLPDEGQRPLVIRPGVTLAARIVSAPSAACLPIDHSERRVRWIPCAPDGFAIEIDIVFTPPGLRVVGWPGARSMRTSLVGSLVTGGGQNVWTVHRTIALPTPPAMTSARGQLPKTRSSSDLKGDTVRTLSFGTKADGSRVIYEYAVEAGPST